MTPRDFVPIPGLQRWHESNASKGKLKILKGPVWGKRVRSPGWSFSSPVINLIATAGLMAWQWAKSLEAAQGLSVSSSPASSVG